MAVGVIAGDSIAGEANAGTLRYLLVAPAGRTRLLLAKYAGVMVFCLAATLVVAASALATGALLFPLGDVTLLSGTADPLLRRPAARPRDRSGGGRVTDRGSRLSVCSSRP